MDTMEAVMFVRIKTKAPEMMTRKSGRPVGYCDSSSAISFPAEELSPPTSKGSENSPRVVAGGSSTLESGSGLGAVVILGDMIEIVMVGRGHRWIARISK